MPEIYQGPIQEDENHTRIGHGSEQIVFKKGDTVIKERFQFAHEIMKTKEFLGAEFYLTKIAHLLFTKNIPDIHAIHMPEENNIQAVHEWRDTSADELHENTRRVLTGESIVSLPQYHPTILPKIQEKRAKVAVFQQELRAAGIPFTDDGLENYVIEEDGNVIYVDRVNPDIWGGNLVDVDALRKTIELKITDPDKKREALQYAERLEHFIKLLKQIKIK